VFQTLKLHIRNLGVRFFQRIGSDIHDERTGERLGRGFLFAWRDRIHLIGVDASLIPVPLRQKRITYWKQEIGFTTHPKPDFPRREPAISLLENSPLKNAIPNPLVVILDHRDETQIQVLLNYWCPKFCPSVKLLLAYGGSASQFDSLSWPNKVFVNDPRLRTHDHQRDRQSYRGMMQAVSTWIKDRNFTHILFMESDHIPLAPDILTRYLTRMTAEDADILGYWLSRLDRTTHPHWLSTVASSMPADTILSMLGTGHFWKREAWVAASAIEEFSELYLELDLPTSAHYLGFRICGFQNNLNRWVRALPFSESDLDLAVQADPWSVHPIKTFQSSSVFQTLTDRQQ